MTNKMKETLLTGEKHYSKIVSCLSVILLVSVLIACQKTNNPELPSSESSFQIHLLSLSQIADLRKADEEIDILNRPQYIISDEQIKNYDWSQQIITFDDTVLEKYISDPDFLIWPSNFVILWDGKVVAEGQVFDTVSPVQTSYPVIYVLEPRGDPNFSASSYKTVGDIHPDPNTILTLSILLRQNQLNPFVDNDLGLLYEDTVAKEIKEHFHQDGRLIE